jgi:hypothetical protein
MPSWKDYERFLKHDGWIYRPQNSGSDKVYVKILDTGEILWTRVSKGSGEIGKGLFAAILKHQAKVSKEYFSKAFGNQKYSSGNPNARRQIKL